MQTFYVGKLAMNSVETFALKFKYATDLIAFGV
jgi:hypothetical protein